MFSLIRGNAWAQIGDFTVYVWQKCLGSNWCSNITSLFKTSSANFTVYAYLLLLQGILYHVVPGKVLSKDLQNDQLVDTLAGPPVRINIYDVSRPACPLPMYWINYQGFYLSKQVWL
jgi:hypothetical protein